ncbi:PREDICTED: pollen receptor-like kinase 4 [Tarenaya hassleriana]|uniref:pollen receptor-like kinase 4 n=1 Tax=Tarenaya hassleriana TaxID=28532 RepID=UPI00053C54B4|nr:PREDICTED: pollen receptor-like kinase 4 [Tarenaya hassleriana]
MLTRENPVMLACNTASTKRSTILIIIIVLCPITVTVMSQSLEQGSDADCLLKFKNTLANGSILGSWNRSTSPCNGNVANWLGVLCYNDVVWGIQLEGKGFSGKLDIDPLVPMRYLRTISFMNNNFDGPYPPIKKLSSLKSLYLSDNRFSGEIPDDAFFGMRSLKKVYLANNAFEGKLPSSLAALPKLLEVRVNGNQFSGLIPDFKQNDLKLASFSNNDLEGPIPESLSTMVPGSFAGNKNLCNAPLSPCSLAPESHPIPFNPTSINKSFFTISIILIVVGIILVIIALVIFFIITRNRNSLSHSPSMIEERAEKYQVYKEKPTESVASRARKSGGADQGKLLFVRNDVQKFDLQDLLTASAEVLGSGTFGASYKASIMGGQMLVAKRYKHMNNVGREEFHEHMRRLGRLSHPNLLPLVAYYYRKEEKLLVTEFMANSSLASHLHANHSVDQPVLDWTTRLKIIKGVAKGLAFLYTELPTLTIPHGHLKSSNIVLDESFEPLLTDYSLRPVMNSEHAHNLMISYKSPEYSQKGYISKKTDVWCLGIVILELLTGKFPENYLTQGYDPNMSLVTWVSNLVKEKKTGDVFDKEMSGKKNNKAEMLNLLKIGLSCCEEDEERRMEMREAVEMIERLRESEFEEDFDSMPSKNNLCSSSLTDDDYSFVMNR